MALEPKLTLEGGPELEATLKGLGGQVAGRLGENAVRAAARVIVAQARKSKAFFDISGETRRSFRVLRQIDRRSGSRTAYAGSTYFVARFLEFGTSRMPPRPSLRPALDTGGQAAVDAMVNNIKTGIDRETARRTSA